MILSSPDWSPTSVQFTHGFPRKLVDARHGGFLPGNVVLTAQATNRCLRRLAVCDVACLVSKCSVAGVGLSYSRLLNLRYAAIKYRGGHYMPNYLTRGMLETGVSFATFEALDVDTLRALRAALTDCWSGEESDSDQEWEGMVPKDGFSAQVLKDLGLSEQDSEQESDEAETAGESRLTNFLCRAVRPGGEGSSADDEQEVGADSAAEPPQTAGATQSTRGRKRRRAGASSSSGSIAGRRGRSSCTPAPVEATEATEATEAAEQPSTSRGVADPFALNRLDLEGLKKDVFPSASSAADLFRFLDKHKPVAKSVSKRFFCSNPEVQVFSVEKQTNSNKTRN